MLYKLIVTVSEEFQYSAHTAKAMQDKLGEQINDMLEIYQDPDSLMRMCEMPDYSGKNIFWYLDEYDMYGLLNSRIVERIICNKWNGIYDLNASLADYSTGFVVGQDRNKIFASERWLSEINYEMFTIDRSNLVHGFKYAVWKHSM